LATSSSLRVLVVDDYEPFRRIIYSTLQHELQLQTIVEASDGVEAIELAKALQPDLVVMDIRLPKVNGIEAAEKILKVAPQAKILFVSQESSVEVVQGAFNAGALGYIIKIDTARELRTAVKAVLRRQRFVSSRFAGHDFTGVSGTITQGRPRHHEAGFYSNDEGLLDGFTHAITSGLMAGNAVIVATTESHRDALLHKLQPHGLDIRTAIEESRYIWLDAADVLSTFMVNGLPDPIRFRKITSELIVGAAKFAKREHPRVVVCGECSPLLWAQGNADAAIMLEQLWDRIAKSHAVDVLCGYSLPSFQGGAGSHVFEKICAAHSAVHYH
jgi:CheY-like chemotaxis protein